jgi:hypothetical protein
MKKLGVHIAFQSEGRHDPDAARGQLGLKRGREDRRDFVRDGGRDEC